MLPQTTKNSVLGSPSRVLKTNFSSFNKNGVESYRSKKKKRKTSKESKNPKSNKTILSSVNGSVIFF